jgi:hypothetical protein
MPMVLALTANPTNLVMSNQGRQDGLGREEIHDGKKGRGADDELAQEHATAPSRRCHRHRHLPDCFGDSARDRGIFLI